MARFSTHDTARLRELQSELATVKDGGPTALTWLIPAVRELLGADKALGGGYRPRGDGIGMDFGILDRIDPDMISFTDRWLTGKPIGWTAFNPLRPEPAQRNVALDLGEVKAITGIVTAPILSEVYSRFGLLADDSLRVLVCEGPSLLAWVGVFQAGAILPRQKRLLTRLIGPMRRRLSVERLLRMGAGLHAVLDAALAEIPAPAFVLDELGTVLDANTAGTEWIGSDVLAKRRALRDAVAARGRLSGAFRVTRIASPGIALRFLVVCKALASTDYRCRAAAREWGFLPRETEVLALLGEGLSNRTIAAQLCVAERTVEAYLTSMFEKAQVEGRAELIVRALRRALS